MIFSYRTRRILRGLLTFLGTVLVLGTLVVSCSLLWLQRFVLYTPDGVQLDLNLSQVLPQGILAQMPGPRPTVSIQYGREDVDVGESQGLKKLQGFYVTTDDLLENLEDIEQRLLQLPQGTPVLLEVKGSWGYFFYPSGLGTMSESFHSTTMERFFSLVNRQGLYTIARLPAFRDYDFGGKNPGCALKKADGSLWAGSDKCFWLDPGNDEVLGYLIRITKELQTLGFDEVVFKDFAFPDTKEVVYEGDQQQVIQQAAETLITACASDSFTLSFQVSDPLFRLPESHCRLYLQNIAAVDAKDVAEQYGLENAEARIVFLTQTNDTRYDICSTLRPIHMAH